MKSKSATLKIIVFVVLVLLSCAYLLPIYVMVTTSLKSIQQQFSIWQVFDVQPPLASK